MAKVLSHLPHYEAGMLHGLADDALELHLAARLNVDLVVAENANLGNCARREGDVDEYLLLPSVASLLGLSFLVNSPTTARLKKCIFLGTVDT